jgi:KaiC/GvpD/RAD55 family RecA-like ATPase
MCKSRVSSLLVVLLTGFGIQWSLSVEIAASETVAPYYPIQYSLLGNTSHVSGSLSDLQSENGSYMVFRSYASQLSVQTLYAHQDAMVINNMGFSRLKLESADAYGIDLVASMNSTGRQLWGKLVYPLTGIAAIPSSTWAFNYRTWHSAVPENASINSPILSGSGTWTNPDEAHTSNDIYASTSAPRARQEYGFYGFHMPSNATITKVEVGYEAYTSSNEELGISLSWDGGSTWTTEYVTPVLETADPDAVTWVDFSYSTDWTAGKLSDGAFLSRMRAIRVGWRMGYVYVDWLPVRVTYTIGIPSARASANILIRKSDSSIRQTLASNVANSNAISTSPETLFGTYHWSSYAVVNETDYLEIDYYLNVEQALSGVTAFLRIDDVTLTLTEQTRLAGVMLPSEYTMEVEFSGSSNADYWSQLLWVADSAWSTDSVSVTVQLHNYTLNAYSTGGDGYIAYVSSALSETDETKSQVLAVNPMDFRDSPGNWKMKIMGVKETTSQFYFMADSVKYEVASIEPPDIAISNIICSPTSMYPGEVITINVTVENEGGTTETFYVTLLCNDTQIGERLVSNLAPSTNTKMRFDWNATEVLSGIYTITAIADVVPWELDVADNRLLGETITILPVPAENDSSLLPFTIPVGIAVVVGLISGMLLKRRKTGSKFVSFDYFNKIISGGIPDGSAVLITGGTSSGKSILCQQLAYKYLTEKKACIFISYDNLPDRIRKDMEILGWDLHKYEQEGTCIFIDGCSSIAGTSSKEKYSVQQPFALTELSIVISTVWKRIDNMPKTLFLDSATSLFTNLDASRVIGFLQDRSAKTKVDGGIFVFTLGKGTLEPNFVSSLEEIVDCIIELDVDEGQGNNLMKLRVKKLRGQSHLQEWVPFRVEPNHGIVFKPKRD